MIKVERAQTLHAVLSAKGDKSVTLRAVLLGALSKGQTVINNPLLAKDVFSTIECVKKLGATVAVEGNKIVVTGAKKINDGVIFNCENSGTLARLLIGALSGLGVNATVVGDSSLSKRPMERVCAPLRMRGAKIESEGGCLPVRIYPASLGDFEYKMEVDSAQVKSAIILSGVTSNTKTVIHEKNPTRDHTEKMLCDFGAFVNACDGVITVEKCSLTGCKIDVPNDPSSAAFYLGLGLLLGEVSTKRIMINPLRDGFYRVLLKAGARIEYTNEVHNSYGVVADVTAHKSNISYFEIEEGEIPTLIDEIPLIAIISAFNGGCLIKGVNELRFKESDRLNGIVELLSLAGGKAQIIDNSLRVYAGLNGNYFEYQSDDHRMIMCAYLLQSALNGGKLNGEECVAVSFPTFFEGLQKNKLCLIGKDLSLSLSGKMHKHILSKLSQEDFTYQMLSLTEDEVNEFLKKCAYKAINATIPYKEKLFLSAKEQSKSSYICECANYLLQNKGYTTDGEGLLLALKYRGERVINKSVCVYGAGGAGRSIALALKNAGAKVYVENRTASKAVDFCKRAGLCVYNGEECDILINATSNVTDDLFSEKLVCKAQTVIDINYNKDCALISLANKLGVKAYDGKDMLFFQAYICDCILLNKGINEELAFELYSKYKVKYEN